jgi:hypothetical protein
MYDNLTLKFADIEAEQERRERDRRHTRRLEERVAQLEAEVAWLVASIQQAQPEQVRRA